ncbi:MAG: hypothetical protein ACOX4A_08125 [Saccharofermentanales bacterium]
MRNLFDLTGKVAVVTGGASGLGADTSRAMPFMELTSPSSISGVDFSKSVASGRSF